LSPADQHICLPETVPYFLLKMEVLNEKVQPEKDVDWSLMKRQPFRSYGKPIIFIEKLIVLQNATKIEPTLKSLLYCPHTHILVTVEN
jgi:hypothetical protein